MLFIALVCGKWDLRHLEDFEDYEPDSRSVKSIHHELKEGSDPGWKIYRRVFKESLSDAVLSSQLHKVPFVNEDFDLQYHDPDTSVLHVPLTLSSIVRPSKNDVEEVTDCENKAISRDKGLKVCMKGSRMFELLNLGPNRINREGNGTEKGHYRMFKFEAHDEARQDENLLVLDYISEGTKRGASSVADSESEALMYSLFYFFPRIVLPALRVSRDKKEIVVTLPTREEIIFDARTKEILYGVFKETEPMDHRYWTERKFAKFLYTGTGMMLRSDQEKESPRLARVKDSSKSSILQFGQQTCRIPNELLWNQNATMADTTHGKSNGHGNSMLFNFPTDLKFFEFVNKTCGWELNTFRFKDLDHLN